MEKNVDAIVKKLDITEKKKPGRPPKTVLPNAAIGHDDYNKVENIEIELKAKETKARKTE